MRGSTATRPSAAPYAAQSNRRPRVTRVVGAVPDRGRAGWLVPGTLAERRPRENTCLTAWPSGVEDICPVSAPHHVLGDNIYRHRGGCREHSRQSPPSSRSTQSQGALVMRGRSSIMVCLATSASIISAGVLPAQQVGGGGGTLKGRVTGPTGEALAVALVSITGTQRGAVARSDGMYQITLPAGRYEVRVRRVGYAASTDSVTVQAGTVLTKDFHIDKLATSLEAVEVLSTHGGERTVISAPVPVDVLSVADLQQSGRTETAQMIQAVAPSFNFPRASISDGTDHIRPATLRGLAPDQTLVLINGKRRHTSALVNVNSAVGRGAQAVDFNAIPASMIDHIEILRDGAAAQYGSDAIAGVINVVLKSTATGSFMTQFGENVTTYNRDASADVAFAGQRNARSVHDGGMLASSLNYGWTFGSDGFLQLGGELRNRDGTNRTLPDTRQQYFTGDPRNSNPPTIDHWQGDSYNHDTQLFFNTGRTIA